MTPLLRMAAIDFLNPAPLMWNFEHPPAAERLHQRYAIEKMSPAACAAALDSGTADIGLIPIGAYASTPGLAIVPGCAIASLGSIRSLLLVIRASRTHESANENTAENIVSHQERADWRSTNEPDEEPDLTSPTAAELARIHTVALDTASRTSALYTQILFRRFWDHTPAFINHAPQLDAMLSTADAALLIGDPALYALRDRTARQARTGECLRYLDLGHLWRQATGTAWVSAFWAVREAGLVGLSTEERRAIPEDLRQSRDAGLAHLPELVAEWAPRLGLRAQTVQTYLSRNIHYFLDDSAIAGIKRFFTEAYALQLIPTMPSMHWLD